MRAIVPAVLSLALAPTAAANDVLVVAPTAGPGVDHTDLQAALDAAPANAIVLVAPGTYTAAFGTTFEIDAQSLTLVADVGGAVNLASPLVVRDLAAGQQVALRGLRISLTDLGTSLELLSNDGSVWVDDCEFVSFSTLSPFIPPGNGARVQDCDAVQFTECILIGATTAFGAGAPGMHGLSSTHSNVALWNSSIHGGHGGDGAPVFEGGDGANVSGGFLFAEGCTFFGGNGGDGQDQELFLPCSDGAPGGNGIELASGAPVVRTRACWFAPGDGGAPGAQGTGLPCSTGAPGDGVDVQSGSHAALPGPEHAYIVSTPVREGETLEKTFIGDPGELVFTEFSGTQGFTYFEVYGGVLALSLGSPFYVFFEGTIPASGTLTTFDPIEPLINPASEGISVWLQSAFFAPPSDIWQGPPQAVVILDGAL